MKTCPFSIQKYGTVRGIRMTVKRLSRCRPVNLDSCIDFPEDEQAWTSETL